MTLEDYIRKQEQKAREAGRDIKASAKDMWQDTKDTAERTKERVSDSLNG